MKKIKNAAAISLECMPKENTIYMYIYKTSFKDPLFCQTSVLIAPRNWFYAITTIKILCLYFIIPRLGNNGTIQGSIQVMVFTVLCNFLRCTSCKWSQMAKSFLKCPFHLCWEGAGVPISKLKQKHSMEPLDFWSSSGGQVAVEGVWFWVECIHTWRSSPQISGLPLYWLSGCGVCWDRER